MLFFFIKKHPYSYIRAPILKIHHYNAARVQPHGKKEKDSWQKENLMVKAKDSQQNFFDAERTF